LLLRAGELVAPAAEAETVSTFAAPMISQVYAYTAGAHQHYGCTLRRSLGASDDRVWHKTQECSFSTNFAFALGVSSPFEVSGELHFTPKFVADWLSKWNLVFCAKLDRPTRPTIASAYKP